MNIGIDMMGGDFAPLEAVKGVKSYLAIHNTNVNLYCIGDEALVKPLLEEHQVSSPNLHLVHAPQVIGYNEHPAKALKEKPQSSIAIGFQLLAEGKIDAFMSAGNTGAMLVGAMFTIKAIPGVLRPTIGATMPKSDGSTGILVDVGLNADCKPEQLNQFAILGSLYASIMLGVTNPTVGLLNIGEEEGKGNALAQATYPLLQQNKQIHFIGNIEGRDILTPKANVTVCDGFTGNIALKLAESLHTIASERGHGEDAYFKRLHFENYGGLPVLGVAKPVIISHGISTATAFHNSIGLAVQMLETGFCNKIAENFTA